MVFRASRYWLDIIYKIMVRNGDLNLIGDYLIVGLGGGFATLHKYLENVEDVTGNAHVIKSHTGLYKGVRISTIAIAGGGVYAEWIVGLAYTRKIKAMVGIGWCGALADYIDVGDIVVPIAAVRDEDTTDHHVEKMYPAVADFDLAYNALKVLEKISKNTEIKVHKGIVLTTSSTLSENPKWGEEWSLRNVIAADGETSIIYTLASLIGIPVINIFTVSDHVVREEPKTMDKQLEEELEKVHDITVKVAYEVLSRIAHNN